MSLGREREGVGWIGSDQFLLTNKQGGKVKTFTGQKDKLENHIIHQLCWGAAVL